MTIRRTYTCDAPGCGVETNGERSIALPYELRRPDVEFLPDHLHGCTKDHLGLALAAQFGIPTDATVERVMQLETKLADAERVARARLTEVQSTNQAYELCAKERSALEERIAELETKLTVVTKDWMAARTDADNQKELGRRTNAELGAATDRIAELEAQLAKHERKVQEWSDAIDALHDVSPIGTVSSPNPTLAEWIRALPSALAKHDIREEEALDASPDEVRAAWQEWGKSVGAVDERGEQGFVKARYEALAGEALVDAYVRPLAKNGFVIQRPRSVHWGTVTEVIRATIDALVEPDPS